MGAHLPSAFVQEQEESRTPDALSSCFGLWTCTGDMLGLGLGLGVNRVVYSCFSLFRQHRKPIEI